MIDFGTRWVTDMQQEYQPINDKQPERLTMTQTKVTLSWFGFWIAVGLIGSALVLKLL